jgi:hypothetical protein
LFPNSVIGHKLLSKHDISRGNRKVSSLTSFLALAALMLLFPTSGLISYDSSDHTARAQVITGCFTSSNRADSDGDGLFDDWEQNGVPYTKSDGTTGKYILPDADPSHKDLYIEIDSMQGHAPLNKALFDDLIAFANAPVKNPDCRGGINLHMIADDQNVPEKQYVNVTELHQLKDIWFGTASERSDIDHKALLGAKDKAYYYVLFAHQQYPSLFDRFGSSSGIAEDIPGRSLLVTLGSQFWGQDPKTGHHIGTVDEQEGTLMHEMGHLLGLRHGGKDNMHYKPNYDSVMNYAFQMASLVNDRPLSYESCIIPTLNESSLNEQAGIGSNVCPREQGLRTVVDAPALRGQEGCADAGTVAPFGGFPIDFNHDNKIENPVKKDLNCDHQYTELISYDDWNHLVFLAKPSSDTMGVPALLAGGNNTMDKSAGTGALSANERELNFEDIQRQRASLMQGLQTAIQNLSIGSVNTTASALAGLTARSEIPPATTGQVALATSQVKNTLLDQIGDPSKIISNASSQNLIQPSAGAAIGPPGNTSGAAGIVQQDISSLIATNQLSQAINQLNSLQTSLTGGTGGVSSSSVLAKPSDLSKLTSTIENIKGSLAKQIITPQDAQRVTPGQIISPSSTAIGSIFTTPRATENNVHSNVIPGPSNASLMWISHLDLLGGDSSVQTSFNSVNSEVGHGLSGLIIQSNTTGNGTSQGADKVVQKALEVPPGHMIKGIRLCYELSNDRTFINQIKILQVQNPPDRAVPILTDSSILNNKGPICINSQQSSLPIDPANGPLLLSLRINSGDSSDRIVIRGLGLLLG